MAPTLLPQRRRGRQSEVARKFLEAAGLAQKQQQETTLHLHHQYPHKKTTSKQSQSSVRSATISSSTATTTPQRSSSHKAHSDGTPRTVSSSTSSTSMYSPSVWGSSKRSSSTRSQHSVKTERTLDTYESSSVPSLQQPQPLQRTSAYVGSNRPVHPQPSTIYEQPHDNGTTTTRPVTPEAHRRPLFPATSPSATRTPPPPTAVGDEIRTTTSSITTHSTAHAPQQYRSSSSPLDAHMRQQQQQQRQPATFHTSSHNHNNDRAEEEDWESVSTNEISGSYYYKSPRSSRRGSGSQGTASRSTTPTLGQSIDQGIDYLVGGAQSFVQCAAANVPRVRDRPSSSSRSASNSPHHSPGRLHKSPSVVSGASTHVATNRAVDMALKRVQEIEASRGTAQALVEARQALERLKDAPSPQPITMTMPSPSPTRFIETKSILSDTTEDEESGSRESSVPVLPSVGRLDQKVNRLSNQTFNYSNKNNDNGEEHSLPNESLPSSIGVEVDSRGATKSNPALRAVFEQHTMQALQREGYFPEKSNTKTVTKEDSAPPPLPTFTSSPSGQDIVYADPVLSAMYNPPPPPPSMDSSGATNRQVRHFSMNSGRGRVVETTVVTQPQRQQLASPVREPSLDPILCTGSYVSTGSPHDCGESSVMASTVVHPPPNLMTTPSHDSSTVSPKVPSIQTKSAGEEWISPLTTHMPAMEEEEESEEEGQRSRPVIRIPRQVAGSCAPVVGNPAPTSNRAQEQLAHDEVAHINQRNLATTTAKSTIRSSPAWASRQRMQERQAASTPRMFVPSPKHLQKTTPLSSSRTPSTPTTTSHGDTLSSGSPGVAKPGNRIASLRRQLFEKPPRDAALDSFVVRRNHSKQVLGEPAVDDTSIDMQSVRSAFESRGSLDKPLPVGDEYDSDDDTASVKSLKEKYEEGSVSKHESEVSKVRAMFEANSRPPMKPFASGSSELQQVFSKFQNRARAPAKVTPQRRLSGDVSRIQPVSSRVEDRDGMDNTTRPQTPVVGSSVADRIRAFGGKSPKTPPVAPPKSMQNRRGIVAKSPLTPRTRGPGEGCNSPATFNSGQEELAQSSPSISQPRFQGPVVAPGSRGMFQNRSRSPFPMIPSGKETSLNGPTASINGAQHSNKVQTGRASPGQTRDDLQSNPLVGKEQERKPHTSPSTAEETRRSFRSSPVPMRPESVAQRSVGLSDVTDESQIEGELAAIAASGPVGSMKSSDSSVRKLDWFQHAAAEVRTMTSADETSIGNRPITPATPSRVQERIRMLAAASGGGMQSIHHSVEKSPGLTFPKLQGVSSTKWEDHHKSVPVNLVQPKPRRPGRVGEPNSEGLDVGTEAPLLNTPGVERSSADSRTRDIYLVAPNNETRKPALNDIRGTSQAAQRQAAIVQSGSKEKALSSGENVIDTENIKESGREASDSGSEFSDGVTLDLSIAEVSGLTMPTALYSRTGGVSVDTVAEGVEGISENSSENVQVEAKRSEASSSQTSEALIPLLNKALRQRPMSDERSMGDSFFEARAFLANRWGKSSDTTFQRNQEVRDDASAGWDLARVESSFPVKPSNADDLFDFESEWVPFKNHVEDDPFRTPDTSMEEKKSEDDLESRSITPTRSNRVRNGESYLDRRYPPLPIDGAPLQPLYGQSGGPPSNVGAGNVDVLATASVYEDGSENSPVIHAISSFDSVERLSRSHLAHHVNGQTARTASVDDSDVASDLMGLSLLSLKPQPASRSTFFGRTHPKSSDPTLEKKPQHSSYDPVSVPTTELLSRATKNQELHWKPPVSVQTNPVSQAMQRYGAQHAALLARLRALKEARVRRANAIYARTTPVFPQRVEIDEHSLSTKSSTQFGGSHFLESLVVD